MTVFEKAQRLKRLPPYLFKEIDRKKAEVQARGVDIIDLGVGDPDLPTPDHIIEALLEAVRDPANHRYPSYSGMAAFRETVADWYKSRFGVELDPGSEVVILIGSKEGIAHLPLAFVDPGDVALVPSPAYPVYHIATLFAGGESYFMPLLRENDFLPDLDAIPRDVAEKARLMFINYPNNPTSAVADGAFFERVVDFAAKNRILVCHDAAYTEMAFDGYRPPSFLETEGAKEVGLEFHSLSKTYNMTGWRIGFAVGNREAIEGLGAIKSNIDSGAFQAVQLAGIAALKQDQSCVEEMRDIYSRRRDMMVQGLREAGFEVDAPKATFYLWVRVPGGMTSAELTSRFLDKGVVVTPGNGFGDPGEGYFRIALTQTRARLAEAIERIKGLQF
ncbi:MAG: LL-diaminopimelate aminotransferase [Deltaproteobacteria bacterium]|nr:LL-diaminopimelate aminotransferase [Deltaproteobacteria bacterium]MBW2016214.1 LL-diaminopimelate aminotransferase [Deltaproteobacteria bacterium]MBW2129074.1 LL-diaminopimelate aminotransferase [Deltaproteobacteria bacterium]MBW2302669.1 LL-diaminopimelate aminotransferase [Deltaproteobacteria bacterium]